jgi:ABC-type sugar transport system substrate-binding protein
MIPKFTGVDYFISVENGARKAAKDYGIDLDWQGDPSGQESAAKQQAYIQTFIDKDYDAILVSALDPSSYADTLKSAMAKGIKVISWDADVQEDARDYFVNQTKGEGYGKVLMENMGVENPNGYVAIVSSDPNASNQNSWIEAIQNEYEKGKDGPYKGIKFFDKIIYAGNSQAEADRVVNTLLTQNPDINGVFAISSMALPATSKACEDLGRPKGSVAIQGAGVPESVREQLQSGEIKSVVCSQPYDLGFLAVEFTVAVLDGKVKPGDKEFVSSLSGKSQLGDRLYDPAHEITSDRQVYLGDPIAYTYDDLDKFRGYPEPDSGLNYFSPGK